MQTGVLLLDTTGKVLSLNAVARELLPRTEGLLLEDGKLALDPLAPEPPTTVQRKDGHPPLKLRMAVLCDDSPKASHVVVTLVPAGDPTARRALLAGRFNLTPAETRMAETVIEGHSPAKIAELLGITLHTVRTYLKRLYGKTGVRNQAGLVRILIRTAGEI